MQPLEIGICTWSIDAADAAAAIQSARSDLGLTVAQVGVFNESSLQTADPKAIRSAAADAGVELCGTFVGFQNVDRSSIAAAARTSGLVPDEFVETRLDTIARGAALTASMGLEWMATHFGAVPEDAGSPTYNVLIERVRHAADRAKGHGVTLLTETGQESAETLGAFIDAVDRPNVGVNFDPGNFVLYGTGDPVRAVPTLAGRIRCAHLKDAVASSHPGVDWGGETALGGGEAELPRVISKLRARGYTGPLLIERKINSHDTHTLRDDVAYVRSMLP
jgi:sugar phosphate isomerase/epimerase